MTETYKKLIATLEEIFQLDQADLDFGIYRIMNQKRGEINDFLQKRLLSHVNEALTDNGAHEGDEIARQLDETLKQAREMGVTNPEELPKVKELRELYQSAGNPAAMANDVFSHLTSFFRRYYNQGDFISQRRYKKDVYAIPYEGEEVKLYWANHDQYYIKTGENFSNYTFKTDNGQTIHFRLRDAQTEQNNNKAQQGKERRFQLAEEEYITHEGKELTLWFTYEPTDKKTKQDDLNAEAISKIKNQVSEAFKNGLLKPIPTQSNPGRSLLEKQLKDYTAKNTFDYFIHKDLGGFLNRELDFYIKNEILNIDDINLDSPQSFEKQLRVIKALKTVARKIIALLAQLEDFQKKLWLKKKMVVQCDYCITLDRIPEEFYPEIAANQAQHDEWVRLFAIDEIKGDTVTLPYTHPLTVDFLKNNPYLLVDTKFFGREWKYKLLATLDNIDEQCDGVLINSENFQALNFLSNKYQNNINGIYIDPPYNTNASEILYKNSFLHSSWLSLIQNRVSISKSLLTNSGIFCLTIDDFEKDKVRLLLDEVFEKDNNLGIIPIRNNPSGRSTTQGVSIAHEYALFYGNNSETKVGRLDRNEKQTERYDEIDEMGPFEWVNFRKHGGTKQESPSMFYPIFVRNDSFRLPKIEWDDVKGEWNLSEKPLPGETVIYPIDENGLERRWKWGIERFANSPSEITVRKDRIGNYAIYIKARMNEKGVLPLTWWDKKEYSATAYGTNLVREMFNQLQVFSYPKSIYAVEDCLKVMKVNEKSTVIDFFVGSGTTIHATINLNRQDNLNRKWIGVEMGNYFIGATLPRVKKAIYDSKWKNGKPINREGISHCFKYFTLESYEDTLNNLELTRTSAQQSLLNHENFGEEYLLKYMLDVESRDSLLNMEMFKKPFGYKLKITENNELKEQEVDLVETFNYLIGLVVDSMQMIRDNVVVYGRTLQDEKILVIWRDLEKTDNVALNNFFRKLQINTRDSEFRRIYVNGDNNLENIRTDDEQWKVVLIEEEFQKRMFDTRDV